MTFDEIQAMWEQDAKIDPVELDTASLSIPQLHSKYFKIFQNTDLKETSSRKLKATHPPQV